MDRYKVELTVTLTKTYYVEGENEQVAEKNAIDAYQQGEIELDADKDFSEYNIKLKKLYSGSFIRDAEKMRDFQTLSKEEFLKSYSYLSESEYDATVRDYEKLDDMLWSAACNGIIDTLEDYYKSGGIPNIRHIAFGGKHSLIMGALRNGLADTAKLLKKYGETVENSEKEEYQDILRPRREEI